MKILRAATRGSKLALAQTKRVLDALQKVYPNLSAQIQIVRTRADRQPDTPLWKLEGSGFFTAALEQALLEGKADLAVHSCKDLPTAIADGLCIAAVLERSFPEDVLVCRKPIPAPADLPAGARIGTSSIRRHAQIVRLRPDAVVQPLRGNVETRLRKLREGQFDAIVLARAGLERLGITDWEGFVFSPEEFVPAPAQGVIAVEIARDNQALYELLQPIHHLPTASASAAERHILARLQPGCHAPVGAYAKIEGVQVALTAFVSGPAGEPYFKEQISGPAQKALELAERLAQILIDKGARQILKNNA